MVKFAFNGGMDGWKTWLGIAGKGAVLIMTELFGADAGGEMLKIVDALSNLFIVWGIAHKIEKAGNGK